MKDYIFYSETFQIHFQPCFLLVLFFACSGSSGPQKPKKKKWTPALVLEKYGFQSKLDEDIALLSRLNRETNSKILIIDFVRMLCADPTEENFQ